MADPITEDQVALFYDIVAAKFAAEGSNLPEFIRGVLMRTAEEMAGTVLDEIDAAITQNDAALTALTDGEVARLTQRATDLDALRTAVAATLPTPA